MLLWLTLGSVLGWLAAIALVRLLGPSDLLDASATPSALARTGVAVAAGLALLGLVAALRSRGMTERGIGVGPGVLAKVPWELAVLALAALAYQRLASQGPPVATGTEPPRIDLLLLAFPMLFRSAPSAWPSGCSAWWCGGSAPPGRAGRTPPTWPPGGSPTAPGWPCCWWPPPPCRSG